ncbi:hypothetical protein GCM10020216_044650 [Nonomuraea helvata]
MYVFDHPGVTQFEPRICRLLEGAQSGKADISGQTPWLSALHAMNVHPALREEESHTGSDDAGPHDPYGFHCPSISCGGA